MANLALFPVGRSATLPLLALALAAACAQPRAPLTEGGIPPAAEAEPALRIEAYWIGPERRSYVDLLVVRGSLEEVRARPCPPDTPLDDARALVISTYGGLALWGHVQDWESQAKWGPLRLLEPGELQGPGVFQGSDGRRLELEPMDPAAVLHLLRHPEGTPLHRPIWASSRQQAQPLAALERDLAQSLAASETTPP